jgi:hypothetical protein
MRGAERIVAITTPASNYDLIDLTTLKSLFQITDDASDAFLNALIPLASQAVQTYCNQVFVVETLTETLFPARDGMPWSVSTAFEPLQLKRWPLTGVTSIVETVGTQVTPLIAGTDYLPKSNLGQILRLNQNGLPRNWCSSQIAVVYSAGYASIPGDVTYAVAQVIKLDWDASQRDPALKKKTIEGVASYEYWVSDKGLGSGNLPPVVKGALEKYRVPVIG